MLGDACTLFPIKNGEPSKLYKDLYNLTKKDRPLTNLLYAISLQKDILKLFSKDDLNTQGEPKTKIYVEKLNINSILLEKAQIEKAAKELDAIDDSGDVIYYDDPNSIISDVMDFNKSHDKLKAVIKYNAEGFYIDVDTINAENYNANSVLETRINIEEAIVDLFKDSGLNTTLSDMSKKLFNPINIYFAINSLKGLKKSTDNINELLASLLVDLYESDPLMVRIKAQFGEDTAKAISQVSGYYYKDSVEVTSMQEKQIKNMLSKINTSMKKIMRTAEIDTLIEEAKEKVGPEKTYMGTGSMSVRDTLKELYKDYHIDQDSTNILGKRVKRMSEAAKQLLQIQIARLNEERLKGFSSINERKLKKTQKEIDTGIYLKGIVDMLEDINKDIKTQEKLLDRKMNNLKKDPSNLTAINELSKLINDQLDLVATYEDVLQRLINNDFLENDDVISEESLLDSISDVATTLHDKIIRMKTNSRKKQVDVVKAFFRIYWGDEKELPDGTIITIDDVMEMANRDINFFDRFIYAANTTNNEQMNLIAEACKQAHERRDNILRKKLKEVRVATKKLHDSGSSFGFMFERDKDGYPSKIVSDYDYKKFDEELAKYKDSIKNDPSIEEEEYDELISEWKHKHMESIEFKYVDSEGKNQTLELKVPVFKTSIPLKKRLTSAQYDYWKTMMYMKAEMLSKIDAASNEDLFNVIEIGTDMTTALAESGGNPVVAYNTLKNKIVGLFKEREDDTEYGNVLDANNVKSTHVNARGEEIMTLPLFYTHEIKDRSRVSTDFSRSMIAYMASSIHYIEMNKILDALMLAKDYMLQKQVTKESGGNILADTHKLAKDTYTAIATTAGINTSLKGLADDFYERIVYGRLKKNEGHIWGTKIRIDKAADTLTGYTSIAGLSVNILGAQANILVGKLQMLIESGLGMGGEFFGVKDMMYADAKYFQLLMPLLNEINSNNKSSFLGLLMEKFDVLDDFYERIKETGFYKNPISKIIGNGNLFFLYGIGEHLLHAQGMLAVLHNKKNNVLDKHGNEVSLLDALEVIKDETGNGELMIKDGYTKKNGEKLTEADLQKIKRKIAYVNKSMHGAFGTFEKGMIHKYAVGRLIMNFRQWMPAHYQRRFRGLHYDTDLGEYREGYYVSGYKFIKGCVQDLVKAKIQWVARYKELSEMQKYNLRRAAAETIIMVMLITAISLLGDEKDKKGNWAYRDLIYQLKRMQMETFASTPLSGYGFLDNIIKVLNSPAAALKTTERISHLLKLTDIFSTIQDGKYKGENRYFHNLERDLPFYGQLVKALELGESEDLFKLFY